VRYDSVCKRNDVGIVPYFEEVPNVGFKIERAEFVNKTFRFNIKLIREVETLCHQKGISMNRFVDIALRYVLEHLDDEDEREQEANN